MTSNRVQRCNTVSNTLTPTPACLIPTSLPARSCWAAVQTSSWTGSPLSSPRASLWSGAAAVTRPLLTPASPRPQPDRSMLKLKT